MAYPDFAPVDKDGAWQPDGDTWIIIITSITTTLIGDCQLYLTMRNFHKCDNQSPRDESTNAGAV
jgi:hypothetical protein